MMKRLGLTVTAAAVCFMGLGGVAEANDITLHGGRSAVFLDKVGAAHDKAVIRFVKDDSIHIPPQPGCKPGGNSWVRIRTSGQDTGEIALPCANWKQKASGAVYKDRDGLAGGVKKVIVRPGKLLIKFQGDHYQTVKGPVSFIEASLTVGADRYCGRFDLVNFKRNQADTIKAKGPSTACDPLPTATPTQTGTPTPSSTPSPSSTPTFAGACGNGVVEVGEQCDEGANNGSGCCSTGCQISSSCSGSVLGTVEGTILPGPSDACPSNQTFFTFLKVTEIFGHCNGTLGDFAPGSLRLWGGVPALDGKAPVKLVDPVLVDATLPQNTGRLCWLVEQDPQQAGWVDCDGGSNADVKLSVDSHADAPNGPVTTNVGQGGDSGSGSAILRVLVRPAQTDGSPCAQVDFAGVPPQPMTFTTANATATILNGRLGGGTPQDTTAGLGGAPFACGNWGQNTTASIAVPNANMDIDVPLLGVFDIAQVLRLELSLSAQPVACGDGQIGGAEECDDGNSSDGDGCSSACNVENGWTCSGEPSLCVQLVCGDGILWGVEECDDGGTIAGDGCSPTCSVESGWQCSGQPSVCAPVICGDGIIEGAEQCDDANVTDGDGCSSTCSVEGGFSCSGEPSVCTPSGGLCPPGTQCAAFNILPGPGMAPGALTSPPGASDTYLQLYDFVGIGLSNVTDGQWGPNPVLLAKGPEDGNGVAPLTWVGESFLGATLNSDVQQFGSTGTVCLHILQDPLHVGWIGCAGGTNPDADLSVDSHFEGPDDPQLLNVPGGADVSAPAGSAVIRVSMQVVLTSNNNADCSTVDYSNTQVVETAFTTRLATSQVLEPFLGSLGGQGTDQSLTLTGVEFNCTEWGSGTGATPSIAAPLFALGFPAPIINEPVDVAMGMRLQLAPTSFPSGNETATPTATVATTDTPTPVATSTPTPTASCGNGVVEWGEQCDDGNVNGGDCCASDCRFEAAGSSCDDADLCTMADVCDGAGNCSGSTADCNDGNACTVDSCDAMTGCVHTANTAACDDGLFCNGADTCNGGACSVHVGDPCAGGSECADTCDEAADSCFDPAGSACTNDGNACTDDECNGLGICVHANNSAPCDDGAFCNGGDTCGGGTCSQHAGNPCTGGPECNTTCNETAQNCFDPVGTACLADGNGCTDDVCGQGACTHPNNTNPCNDGNACTTQDTCSSGSCVGGPSPVCDDGQPCTDDSCDPISGCVNTPNTGNACDDGQSCTTADICTSGVCGGTSLPPWINEIDYDDYKGGGPNNDRDEFIEIAGPAGLDLSGYTIMGVEGKTNGTTPFFTHVGDIHWSKTFDPGTVLDNDTATGIGFLVVCFTQTSTTVSHCMSNTGTACTSDGDCPAGDRCQCDVVFPGPASDSNFKNGHLTNGVGEPDGVVLVDSSWEPGSPAGPTSMSAVVDAVSYEGIVPQINDPTRAADLFYVLGSPYNAGTDEGWNGFFGDRPGISLEKLTDTLTRATASSEWRDTGGCVTQSWTEFGCQNRSATPGRLNAGQGSNMICNNSAVCGNGAVEPPEACESAADCPDPSTQFCSACQCLPRCGNGVVDGNEQCEDAGQCPLGQGCNSACQCQILCGNGEVNPGEQCEADADCADPAVQFCDAACQCDLRCGNGVVDGNEQCDVANGDSDCADPIAEYCDVCQCLPRCGNGVVDGNEQCETDAECAAGQTCVGCQCSSNCGNGQIDAGEQCEVDGDCDALFGPGYACSACTCEPLCGNGVLDPGESCDEGLNNSDQPNATCRSDCTAARCGDGIVDDQFAEQCDEGVNNSDSPDASCRTDCTPQRCGDGIVDSASGETCESNADCNTAIGETCDACQCQAPLGVLNFSPVPGPGGTDMSPGCPSEPSNGSFLKTHGGPTGGIPGAVCNGTLGDFYTVGGPIGLMGGVPDANGVASLTIAAPAVVGASIPNVGGDACWRFEQDVTAGFVDCDGGSAADVLQQIDSSGSSPPSKPQQGPYVLGGSDAGPGAAVILAIVKRLQVSGTCPAPSDPAWSTPDSELSTILVTASAASQIDNPRRCTGSLFGTQCPSANPFLATLSGANFDCNNWTENSGAKLVAPFQNLDEVFGNGFSDGDIAQVLRLQD